MDVSDIVIFPADYYDNSLEELQNNFPPPKDPIFLTGDIWVGKLKNHIAKRLMDECDQKFVNRQYFQLYAFVNDNPAMPDDVEWDPDQTLQKIVAISRLIHPTSISLFYSARITWDDNNYVKRIDPTGILGNAATAYVAEEARNWLSKNDIIELKPLYEAYIKNPLSDNLSRALWYHEYAAREFYLDVRWLFISLALEALINTDSDRSSAQFKERVPKLGQELGISISKSNANYFFAERSKLAHGQKTSLSAANKALYITMEDILRKAIKKAILDPTFSDFLSNPKQINSRWPINTNASS